jgi:hypothetical protein
MTTEGSVWVTVVLLGAPAAALSDRGGSVRGERGDGAAPVDVEVREDEGARRTTACSRIGSPGARRYLEAHPGEPVGLARLLGRCDRTTTGVSTQPTAEALAARPDRRPLNANE